MLFSYIAYQVVVCVAMNSSIRLTVVVCIALAAMQILYIFVPIRLVDLYNLAMRPLAYSVLAVMVYVLLGRDARFVKKGYESNMVAIVAVILYGTAFLLSAYWFGAGENTMFSSLGHLIRNLWAVGYITVLGELIRYKLIKSASNGDKYVVIAWVVLSFSFAQVNELRFLIGGTMSDWPEFIFAGILVSLVVNAVVSVVAVTGSFWAVLLISATYSVGTTFTPILPQLQQIAWALVVCALAAVVYVIYYFATNDKSRAQHIRIRRAAKYQKKSPWGYVFTLAVLFLFGAFFMRELPFYPVVIRTHSMAGTFDQGSMVFIEQVPLGEAFYLVGEGYVIHYMQGRHEFVHRVVDFRNNALGQREFITKGDANELADFLPVQQEDVLGIARSFIPYIGFPYLLFEAIVNPQF